MVQHCEWLRTTGRRKNGNHHTVWSFEPDVQIILTTGAQKSLCETVEQNTFQHIKTNRVYLDN